MNTEEVLIANPLRYLESGGLTVLVVNHGRALYESFSPGIRPLLELVDWFPAGLDKAVVADRVVGGCAARVFAHLDASRVLGLTGSLLAQSILHSYSIPHDFRSVVVDIRNRDDTGTCPFEALSREYEDPRALIAAMREKLSRMQARPL